MKRRITLSIALALSVVLLALMKSDSTANAAPPQRFTADTGVVALGPNQVLRISTGDMNRDGDFSGTDDVRVRFRRMEYTLVGTDGGVWRLAIASQNTSDPITLMPGEAASIAVDPSDPNVIYVRVAVVSSRRDVRVNAFIIDDATQSITAISELEIVAF